MCNTAPSPFSLCFSETIPLLLSNLRGSRLEVGLKLKDVGIDGGGKSDKSIDKMTISLCQRQAISLTGFLVC